MISKTRLKALKKYGYKKGSFILVNVFDLKTIGNRKVDFCTDFAIALIRKKIPKEKIVGKELWFQKL